MKEVKSTEGTMQALADVASKLKLALPELPTLTKLGDLSGDIKAIAQQMREIRQNVKDAMAYVDDVAKYLASFEGDDDALKVAEYQTTQGVVDMQDYIKCVLSVDDLLLRGAAVTGFLEYSFSKEFPNFNSAAHMLDGLVQMKLLRPATAKDERTFMVRYDKYALGEDLGLNDRDASKITGFVEMFSRKLDKLEANRRHQHIQQMATHATITFSQFRDGENGYCLFHVPAENYIDHGQTKWLGGGHLLIEAGERFIYPVDSAGSIDGLIARMKELRVRITRESLQRRDPPGIGKDAFLKIKNSVKTNLGLNDSEAEEYIRKEQSFWNLIVRGTNAFEDEETILAAKNEMGNGADITPAQFFGLNGSHGQQSHGTAMLEFEGTFRLKDGTKILEPFFLAERGKDNEGEYFSVKQVPTHMNNALGHLVGKKFSATSDYGDCPPLLSRLMRIINGQEAKAAEIATTEGEEEYNEE